MIVGLLLLLLFTITMITITITSQVLQLLVASRVSLQFLKIENLKI